MVSVRLRVSRAALLLVSCLPPRMALDDAAALAEQHELRLRLDALESQLDGDEPQYAYVIVKVASQTLRMLFTPPICHALDRPLSMYSFFTSTPPCISTDVHRMFSVIVFRFLFSLSPCV